MTPLYTMATFIYTVRADTTQTSSFSHVWLVEPDAANLDDSVARCAQLVSFEHRDILGYYGHLNNADINLLVSELSKLNESDFIHLRVR